MNGFIEVPSKNRRFPYKFEDQTLTVYSADSLPLSVPTDLGITSSEEFLIASVTGKSSLVVFFVDHLPFSEEGPIFWTSTTLKVYYYIDGIDADRLFVFNQLCVSFDELDYFFDINSGMKRKLLDGKAQTIETLPYEDTKKVFHFACKDKDITGEFGIVQTLRWSSTVPLELHNS